MLIRFDPYRDFTEQLRGPLSGRGVRMDAVRRGDSVIVRFDLPGVDPGSIDVTVDRNVLTVKAERQSDRQEGDEVLIAERPHGCYTRQLFLGDTLDTERIEAEYRDGVLTLTIPVAEPRKVQIAAGEQQVQRIETATGTGQGQEGDQATQTEPTRRRRPSASPPPRSAAPRGSPTLPSRPASPPSDVEPAARRHLRAAARRRPLAVAHSARNPEREEADEGCAPAEIVAISPVEGAGVARGIVRARIGLGPARAAAPLALPAHSRAVGLEPEPMPEHAAGKRGHPEAIMRRPRPAPVPPRPRRDRAAPSGRTADHPRRRGRSSSRPRSPRRGAPARSAFPPRAG
jgi:HSP20 family protein